MGFVNLDNRLSAIKDSVFMTGLNEFSEFHRAQHIETAYYCDMPSDQILSKLCQIFGHHGKTYSVEDHYIDTRDLCLYKSGYSARVRQYGSVFDVINIILTEVNENPAPLRSNDQNGRLQNVLVQSISDQSGIPRDFLLDIYERLGLCVMHTIEKTRTVFQIAPEPTPKAIAFSGKEQRMLDFLPLGVRPSSIDQVGLRVFWDSNMCDSSDIIEIEYSLHFDEEALEVRDQISSVLVEGLSPKHRRKIERVFEGQLGSNIL